MKKDQGNWEVLLRYVKGELSSKEKKDLEARLKSDKVLAEDFRILKAIQETEKNSDQENKYSAHRALSDQQFREYMISKKYGNIPYGIRTSDSGLSPAIPDVRRVFDTETKDSRRIKFRINDLVLLVSSYPVSSETFDVRGRIIGIRDDIPITVVMISGKTKFKSICDESYVFEFERVPALKYTLKIMHKDTVIGLADFEL